ncbi:MAG: hypothetical protein A2020_10560 [Lentisphaerae bacterium GWF2_45_14]|nr:MAG: hypothetical protein A2020_10560 [Lentisphaerae bacterium GWF2_45_14]
MNRVLKIYENDIIADSRSTSDVINSACSHARGMKVTGCCRHNDVILIVLEESQAAVDKLTYVIAPLPEGGPDEVIGEMASRYFAGFTTFGGFEAGGKFWGLFGHPRNSEKNLEKS